MRDAASRLPPSSEPPVEGIFPLELTWLLTPFPESLSDPSINRGSSLRTHAFRRMNAKDRDADVLNG